VAVTTFDACGLFKTPHDSTFRLPACIHVSQLYCYSFHEHPHHRLGTCASIELIEEVLLHHLPTKTHTNLHTPKIITFLSATSCIIHGRHSTTLSVLKRELFYIKHWGSRLLRNFATYQTVRCQPLRVVPNLFFCRNTLEEWRHIHDTLSWEYQNFTVWGWNVFINYALWPICLLWPIDYWTECGGNP
jgi:hypothetical protein